MEKASQLCSSSLELSQVSQVKHKLQASQNKCIKFCLKLGNRTRLTFSDFKEINWLPVTNRVFQCILAHIFKYFSGKAPSYVDELFFPKAQSNVLTRQGVLKLHQPSRKTNYGKNTISFLGPKLWNTIPDCIKQSQSLNCFKHKIKDHFLLQLEKEENDLLIFY